MSRTPSSDRTSGRFLYALIAFVLTIGLTALAPAPASGSVAAASSASPAASNAKSVAKCAKKNAYLAEYYRGRKTKGKPVAARCEKRVNATYAKGKRPKGVNVGPNNFSVKWTTIESGKARRLDFRAVADNWVAIRVDGKTVVGTHKAGKYISKVRSLRKGKHTVQFRYTKKAGAGYIKAEYVKAPDRTTPRRPRALKAKAGDSSVALKWKGSDEVDLRGYRVFRNGRALGEVGSTSFTDTRLKNRKRYRYVVRAVDYRGNTSAPSNTAGATPKDRTGPADRAQDHGRRR